jgi:FkbM family methyltransferase
MSLDLAAFGQPRTLRDLLAFKRIGVFGASPAAAEVEALLTHNGKTIAAYFDNSAKKHGTEFRGSRVRPGSAAEEFAAAGGAIVIAAAYQREIATQLTSDFKIPSTQVFPYISHMFSGHFGREAIEPYLSRITRLIERVADDASRRYIEALVRFRWSMDPTALERNPNLTGFYRYNHADLGPRAGDHIVDCGAFTGDTAQEFLDRVAGDATVTAIEPLSRNFAALSQWIANHDAAKKVTPIKAAVGAHHGVLAISSGDDAADPRARMSGTQGEELATVETIDRLFFGKKDKGVDFIKLDTEGFELEAIDGARHIIRTQSPDFAIAGYHKPEHLWEIPERLESIRPGYRIFIGHHPSAVYECEFFGTARPAAHVRVA